MLKSIRILLVAGLLFVFLSQPVMADSASTCLTRAQGDADCNGTVDFVDYFYYVQHVSGIQMPPGVSADFNQDGRVNGADRNIIVARLGGNPLAVVRFFERILASVRNFRI